jgi:serine/threonine-protein kinase
MTQSSNFALVGRVIARRFTVRRVLGKGGMATVYLAEQADEPREVALKIMNEALMRDRTFMKRFQREARTAALVEHPNTVRILDYGTAEGLSYIAMEFVRGDDLYGLLEKRGALAPSRAARILAEVCDGLSAAHALGIVHRDLKPENIMVIPDRADPSVERVKVLDFGIAKVLMMDNASTETSDQPTAVSAVTNATTLIGTPAYMSPEQCGLRQVDTRADIYTCGVLLFQLVTGRLPFEGQSPLHTATMHIHWDPPKPSEFVPNIAPALEALILKALEKKPESRFQTAADLAFELRSLAPKLPNEPMIDAPPSIRAPSVGFDGTQPSLSDPGTATPHEESFATAFPTLDVRFGNTLVAELDPRESALPPHVLVRGTGPTPAPPPARSIQDGPRDTIAANSAAPIPQGSEPAPSQRSGPLATEIMEAPSEHIAPPRTRTSTLPRPLATSARVETPLAAELKAQAAAPPRRVEPPALATPTAADHPSAAEAHRGVLATQPSARWTANASPAADLLVRPSTSDAPEEEPSAGGVARAVVLGFLAAALLLGALMAGIALVSRH